MYNVKHMIIPGIDPPYFSTVDEDNGTIEVKATRIRIIGNKLYCDVPVGCMYTVPMYAVLSTTYEDGTPYGTDEDEGGSIYHQYNRDRRTPTGVASCNPDMLALWLLGGYDVVVELFVKDGNIERHYITSRPEFLINL